MSKRVLITDFFSNKTTVKSKKVKTEKKPEPKVEVKESPIDQPTVNSTDKTSTDYDDFCKENNFNKTEWIESLTPEQRNLLQLEIDNLHITWLAYLHKELTKPYFLKLKNFLKSQSSKTIFPPSDKIYSWSHLTPLPNVKCLILGQDPYHGVNQAHGLAFSVLEPTRPPPSLINIYKTLAIDYPQFEIPDYKKLTKAGTPGGGNLTQWAERGVLMLNAVLTVEAHKANSHAGQGWEEFTEKVIEVAIDYHKKHNQGFVIMAWGSPAQKRVAKFNKQLNNDKDHFLVLRTVHPSPLSAHRGFFESKVFVKCNEWLEEHKKDKIDWGILPGNSVQ
ncbi:ung1 Uracil-DNA glycosylase [Candida maltosa Xu316]|uniref:Uracil-DNA glycosylase n=1 Tax=Candida maltosa (strain Xu316) TaxID=1245528 RepID=M3JT42_CANMX|nr:Uracil-DNA glycosylase, mitochondrial, putative [Candida maltosa Xu316]